MTTRMRRVPLHPLLGALVVLVVFSSPVTLLAHAIEEVPRDASAQPARALPELQELEDLTAALLSGTPANKTPGTPLRAAASAAAGMETGESTHVKTAQKRAALMERIAELSPETFLQNVMPDAVRARFSADVQAVTEKPVTLAGTMEVLHRDDFTNPKLSSFEYHVRVANARLAFRPVGEMPAVPSGTAVKITGYQVGNTVVAAGDASGVTAAYQPVTDAVGTQRTLFILITGPGKPATPTPAQLRTTIFNGAFQKYYKEQSSGKIAFSGDLTQWISLPSYSTDVCQTVGLDNAEVKNYITSNSINLARYSRAVFVVNGASGGCAYVGKISHTFNGVTYKFSLGWVGYSDSSWERPIMSRFEYVLAHEMGHELGVMHANSWECTGTSLDKDCSHGEYGNSYDVMGFGTAARHFNAFYKDLLGWLDSASKIVVSATGVVTLKPLEMATGTRAAIIKNPGTPGAQPMYLEFRQPIGFDSVIEASAAGLFINQVIVPNNGGNPHPRLIDANYAAGSASSLPKSLMPGQSFKWTSRGVTISSLTTSTSSARFKVTLVTPVCTRAAMTITDVEYTQKLAPDGFGYLQFSLRNNDSASCTSSTVTFTPTISPYPSTFELSQYPSETTTIAPGESYLHTAYVSPSASARARNYVFTVTVADAANARSYPLRRTITVVVPPTLTQIYRTSGLPGSTVRLTGTGFNVSPMTNKVWITNSNTYAEITGLTAASSTVQRFVFPKTMKTYTGGTVTPFGAYDVFIARDGENLYSNGMTFTVKAASAPAPTSAVAPASEATISSAPVETAAPTAEPVIEEVPNLEVTTQSSTE